MDNVSELQLIRDATSHPLKFGARRKIRKAIRSLRPLIESANKMPPAEREETLKSLLTLNTLARQEALRRGAAGYGDASWAAAAACESWLTEILLNKEDSDDKFSEKEQKELAAIGLGFKRTGKVEVERLINELENR